MGLSQSMQEMPSKQNKIAALTGVRALAALWVVSLHFGGEFKTLLPVAGGINWLTGNGRFGVDIFFILSGYILSRTYQNRIREFNWRSYLQFVWYRFARIYPAYLISVMAAVAIVAMAILFHLPWSQEKYRPGQLLLELIMMQQWTFRDNVSWNHPDWSVSAEWFAYLLIFPLTYMLLKRIKSIPMVLVVLVLSLGSFVICGEHDHSTGSWGLLQVAMEFIAGAMVYKFSTLAPAPAVTLQNIWGTGVLAMIFAILWAGQESGVGKLLLLLGFGMLLFLLGCEGGLLSSWLGIGVVVYLGEISYSIYLTHGIDQRILKDILPVERYAGDSLFLRLGLLVIFIAVIIGSAALLYHLVEVPAREYLRKKFANESATQSSDIL